MIGPSPPLFHPFSPSLLCAFRRPFHCAHEIGPETRHPLQTRRKRRDTPASFALATTSAHVPRRSRERAPDPVRRFRQNMATKPRSGTKTPPCGEVDFTPPGHSRSPFRPQGTKSRESVPERGFVARKRSEIRTSPQRARKRRERGRGPAQPATSAASRSPRFRTPPLHSPRGGSPRMHAEASRLPQRTAELPGAPHGRAPEARRDVPTTRGASQPFAQSVVQKPRIVERPRPIRARRAVY